MACSCFFIFIELQTLSSSGDWDSNSICCLSLLWLVLGFFTSNHPALLAPADLWLAIPHSHSSRKDHGASFHPTLPCFVFFLCPKQLCWLLPSSLGVFHSTFSGLIRNDLSPPRKHSQVSPIFYPQSDAHIQSVSMQDPDDW